MAEMTLVGMRVLREVAARGSFSSAAQALGYTQSAVSRQVALMEEAAGARLFERLPRGVRLTAHGDALLAQTGAILERVDAAALKLRALDDAIAGTIAIGAFPTALAALVPRALARLAADHPGLRVGLREGGSAAQLRRLRAARVQVAVIAVGGGLSYDLDGLEASVLAHGTPRLAVAADHPLADRGWVNVAELEHATWIVGEADESGPQFGVWPGLSGEPRVGHALRDWPARLGLVAAGLGVALIPSILAGALPAGVVALRVEDPRPLRRDVLAVTRVSPTAAAQAVVESLREAGASFADGVAGSP